MVRDLGRAVTQAVRRLVALLPAPVPVLACHQHFLRDLGTDLLKSDHNRLRELFRNFGVRGKLGALVRDLGRRLATSVPALRTQVQAWAQDPSAPLPTGACGLAVVRALGQWALDSAADGRHQGFPFARPWLDFYRRCLQLCRASAALTRHAPADPQLAASLARLQTFLEPLQAEVAFRQIARRMEDRTQLFDELRSVLRLDGPPPPASGPDSATEPTEETPAALQAMETAFATFAARVRHRRAQRGLSRDERALLDVLLRHLDRHGATLWGHILHGSDGATRIVARTNNLLEGLFHGLKHGERRRSGRKVLTQDFEGLPAAVALVHHLTRPDYQAGVPALGHGPGRDIPLARVLSPYCVSGSADLLDGQSTLDLRAAAVGLGLNEVVSVGVRFARAGYAAVTDFATQRLRAQSGVCRCLLADESHHLLADPAMSRWLERQLREARKQGVSVTVVSQGIGDFLGQPSGRAVFQNAAAKLYLHQPAAGLDAAAHTLGCDPAVLGEAVQLPRGHAILAVSGRTVQVQVRAPTSLHRLFRTDVNHGRGEA